MLCRLQEISGISPLVRDLCLTICFCDTDDSVALGQPHSIQAKNTTKDGAEFLLIFDSGEFSEDSTFLLTDWLAHVPKGRRYHSTVDCIILTLVIYFARGYSEELRR
jgi:hypothetical protein